MSSTIESPSSMAAEGEATYRKIILRILPFLMLCHILNYLDRINVGIAKLQFQSDLRFSDAAYGLGAGLLFFGYVLFEIPSTLIMAKIGVRKHFLRIMVGWGIMSTMTMFVRTPMQFYIVRVLIGVAEAGFTPGIFLYLSYWFPARRRARVTSWFYLAMPLASMIGSPISAWIMHAFGGALGLRGWQWLFMLEGMPSAVCGLLVYWVLSDRPEDAHWLKPAERELVLADLRNDELVKPKQQSTHVSLRAALTDPRVFCAGFVFACSFSLGNTLAFWGPTVIRQSGIVHITNVGLLAGVYSLVGIIVMVIVGRHSDRTLERRWHYTVSLLCAAAAVALLPLFRHNPVVAMILLSVMCAGHYSALSVFWSIPPTYLRRETAAAGIAVINVIGSVGGAVSISALGWMSKGAAGFGIGLGVLAAVICCGAVVLLIAFPTRMIKAGETSELATTEAH